MSVIVVDFRSTLNGLDCAQPASNKHPDSGSPCLEGPDSGATVRRLTIWSDQARRRGRTERSDELLLLAWLAYDRLPAAGLRHRILGDAAPEADLYGAGSSAWEPRERQPALL